MHPSKDLVNPDLIQEAEKSPNRVADALRPGVGPENPAVTKLVSESYDPYFGKGKEAWEDEYWPTKEYDAQGNKVLKWPDPDLHPNGFQSPDSRVATTLKPGDTVDRFGVAFGRYVSPADTPLSERGIPIDNLAKGYHQYEVAKPLPTWEGPIAPAMGSPGGGVQHYLPAPVIDLINSGYLKEIDL